MNYIIGTGHCYPSVESVNSEIESRLALEEGWIQRRTGFRARRYCDPKQATSDLAKVAAAAALENAGVDGREIGMLLLATSTPDYLLPGTAPALAAELGITGPAMDLMAACTGFLHALGLADAWATATGQRCLVVAANVLSRRVNPADSQTIGLFGDGAGAVVVSPQPEGAGTLIEIHSVVGGNQGQHWKQLYIPVGGSRLPMNSGNVDSVDRFMQMESGRAVFKLAVESMQSLCSRLLENDSISPDQIDWLIPHQASLRIVLELGKRLGISKERIAWWLDELGNSSAATIPLAISLGFQKHRFKVGDQVLLAAAGSGMSSGAALLKVLRCKQMA